MVECAPSRRPLKYTTPKGRPLVSGIGRGARTVAGKARRSTSAHFHHDESEIVELLRVADPVLHLGGNPRADLARWKVSGLAEQLLQVILAVLKKGPTTNNATRVTLRPC